MDYALIGQIAIVIGQIIVYWLTRQQIKEIHLTMNSRLDQLMKAQNSVAYSKGYDDRKKEGK